MKKEIEGFKCCICGEHSLGWGDNKEFGNNPYPVKEDGECCDKCNITYVIPARIMQTNKGDK